MLQLNTLPDVAKYEAHIWADYIELRCLADPDGILSKSDVLDLLLEQEDFRGKTEEDPNGFESETTGSNGHDGDDHVLTNIRDRLWIDETFKQFEYRTRTFKEFYPFFISTTGGSIHRQTEFNDKHRFYFYLLLAANTGYIQNKSLRTKFTSSFEVVSLIALQKYLPDNAVVRLFGSNPLNKGRYKGQLLAKIKVFANDIGENFIGVEAEYNPHDVGDNGLDIVAWLPIEDNARGFLTILGQCACTEEDWAQKQSSSSIAHWRDVIQFKVPPTNMVFIPFCYRRFTGEWHMHRKIDESIVVDRLRLVLLIGKSYKPLSVLPEQQITDAINYRNDPV